MPRRGCCGRDLPRALPDRVRDRRPGDAGRRAGRGRSERSRPSSRRARTCGPVFVVGAPLRKGNRLYNCAVVIHRGTILGVVPKGYLPTYREFYEARYYASGATDQDDELINLRGETVPFGPDLIFEATDVPGLALHVEICEDMWVPIPPSASRGARRCDRAREPVRQPDHGGPCRGPPAAGAQRERALPRRLPVRRRRRGRVEHRPVLGRPDDGLRVRRPARGDRAVPRPARGAPSSTSTSTGSGRSGCGRAPSRTTRRGTGRRHAPGARLHPGSAVRRHRPAPHGRPVPVRARRPGPARARLLRGLQHPGLRPRAAAAGDRSAEGRHRRLRWSGLDARADRRRQGDGPARPAAQRHPRVHDAGVRDRRLHQEQRHPALQGARRQLRGARHPAGGQADAHRPRPPVRGAARRSTTSPSRTSRPVCAPTTSSGSPTTAAASCSAPATSPSWRSAGAPTASATRCRTTP